MRSTRDFFDKFSLASQRNFFLLFSQAHGFLIYEKKNRQTTTRE